MRVRAVVSGSSVALVLAALGVAGPSALGAGLSAPKDAGAIAQGSIDVLVVQAGQGELLVLQTSYELKGGKPVDSLGWAIPVPAAPPADQCSVVSDALFPELAGLGVAEKAAPPAAKEAVGSFEVSPLVGKGPAGVTALAAWLDTGGYAPFRDRDLRLYSGAGFGYVGVKVTDKSGKLPVAGVLHPFGVRVQATRPYVPLKLLAQAGSLDVRITVLAAKALDAARTLKQGFALDSKRAAKVEAKDLPKSLVEILAGKLGGSLADELKKGPVSLVVLEAKGLNTGAEKAKQIESWFTDPEISFAR